MKFRPLFFVALLVVCINDPANAAFRMKKKQQFAVQNVLHDIPGNYRFGSRLWDKIEHSTFYKLTDQVVPHKKRKEGWEGEAALICGLLGLITILPAIPAIILGYIGLEKDKNRGEAMAGIVLGYIVLGGVVTALIVMWLVVQVLGSITISVM